MLNNQLSQPSIGIRKWIAWSESLNHKLDEEAVNAGYCHAIKPELCELHVPPDTSILYLMVHFTRTQETEQLELYNRTTQEVHWPSGSMLFCWITGAMSKCKDFRVDDPQSEQESKQESIPTDRDSNSHYRNQSWTQIPIIGTSHGLKFPKHMFRRPPDKGLNKHSYFRARKSI